MTNRPQASSYSASCHEFTQAASSAIVAAGARRIAVVVFGYTDSDVRSLGDAADLVTDWAAGLDGSASRWLVVDSETGDSRTGGIWNRATALETLRCHYAPDAGAGHDAPDWDDERSILVSQHVVSRRYRLAQVQDPAVALREAGGAVLKGWLPVALVDLDLGRLTELRISAPAVAPAEDQGAMVNPLAQ